MEHRGRQTEPYDVAIIGGGPAGLSAALILGRCRREVVVIDSGEPRNFASRGLHGFLTRDGVPPGTIRRLGAAELRRYDCVHCRDGLVTHARRVRRGFDLTLSHRQRIRARRILFATGREDLIPDKPGFRKFYGKGVYHCPLCDGWEHRDEPFVVYARHNESINLAVELRTWTEDITVCTDGAPEWNDAERLRLAHHGIAVRETNVEKLSGDRLLRQIHFVDGTSLACGALFFCTDCPQKSRLPANLGCAVDEDGAIVCDGYGASGIPGVYVAGNVRGGLHLAIMAAAEGAEAAVLINDDLLDAGIFPHRRFTASSRDAAQLLTFQHSRGRSRKSRLHA